MPEAFALLRAILIGGVIGATPFIWLTIAWALETRTGLESGLWPVFERAEPFCLAALLISVAIVLVASMVIGLPLTYYLKHTRQESGGAYIGVGALAGFVSTVILLFLLGIDELFWLPFVAALSGAVTGASWWRSMRRLGSNG